MRVLFINSVYKEKSTGTLVSEIEDYLIENGHSTITVYGRGKKRKQGVKIQSYFEFLINVFASRITGKTWDCFAKRQTKRIIKIIEEFKPDIINIHQFLGYYMNPHLLLNYIQKNKIKTIVTLHDFTAFTGKCGHPMTCDGFQKCCGQCPRIHEYPKSYFFDRTKSEFLKKKETFNNAPCISFVAVSEWLKQKAILSPVIQKSQIYQINNGINTELFKLKDGTLKTTNYVTVVSSNFKDKIKGADFLIDVINESKKIESKPVFVLIGKNSKYVKRHVSNKDNVLSLGILNRDELLEWYSKSKCTFVCSEYETFSLPVVESLCSGVPVVGPKGCGAPEFLIKNRFSNFNCERDPKKIAAELNKMLTTNADNKSLCDLSQEASKMFDVKIMCKNYLNLFETYCKK